MFKKPMLTTIMISSSLLITTPAFSVDTPLTTDSNANVTTETTVPKTPTSQEATKEWHHHKTVDKNGKKDIDRRDRERKERERRIRERERKERERREEKHQEKRKQTNEQLPTEKPTTTTGTTHNPTQQ